MKIIIDTNVLISAILKGGTARVVIQFMIDSDNYKWIISREILREYQEVLSRPKFKLTQEVIEEWLEVLDTVPELVKVDEVVDFPKDRKDAKFLACALMTNADFLITGDKDFNEAGILGQTRIITPSLFKQLFIDSIRKMT